MRLFFIFCVLVLRFWLHLRRSMFLERAHKPAKDLLNSRAPKQKVRRHRKDSAKKTQRPCNMSLFFCISSHSSLPRASASFGRSRRKENAENMHRKLKKGARKENASGQRTHTKKTEAKRECNKKGSQNANINNHSMNSLWPRSSYVSRIGSLFPEAAAFNAVVEAEAEGTCLSLIARAPPHPESPLPLSLGIYLE